QSPLSVFAQLFAPARLCYIPIWFACHPPLVADWWFHVYAPYKLSNTASDKKKAHHSHITCEKWCACEACPVQMLKRSKFRPERHKYPGQHPSNLILTATQAVCSPFQ